MTTETTAIPGVEKYWIDGRWRACLADGRRLQDVAIAAGISPELLRVRLKSGWPLRAATSLPVGSKNPERLPVSYPDRAGVLRLPDGRSAYSVAKANGICEKVWRRRVVFHGWPVGDAVTVPTGKRGKRNRPKPMQITPEKA